MIIHEAHDKQEMFSVYGITDLFLTTGNSVVNLPTMELVCGAGHAKQTIDRFDPQRKLGIKHKLAQSIHKKCLYMQQHGKYTDLKYGENPWQDSGNFRMYHAYGVVYSANWPKAKLGVIQTKYDWRKDSPIALVKYSIKSLKALEGLLERKLRRPPRIDLPMPGTGLGNLKKSDVLELLGDMKDNIHVWTIGE